MIIKAKDGVGLDKIYEVFEEVEMQTPGGKTVTVLELQKETRINDINREIAMINNNIITETAQKTELENILAEINNL